MVLKSNIPSFCKLNIFLISASFTLPFAISMKETMINSKLKNSQGLQVTGKSRPRTLC